MTGFLASLSVVDYIFLTCGALGSFFFVLRAIALFLGFTSGGGSDALEANSGIESTSSLLEDLNGDGIPDVLEQM